MGNLFDDEGDIAPPTVGEEVGQALAPVIEEINRSNSALANTIAQAVRDALGAVDARPVAVLANEWTKLEFKVIRNKAGDLDSVVVTRG